MDIYIRSQCSNHVICLFQLKHAKNALYYTVHKIFKRHLSLKGII